METFLIDRPKPKSNTLCIFVFILILLQISIIVISTLQLLLLGSAFSDLSGSFNDFENSFLNDEIKSDIVKLIKFVCNITKVC